MLKRCSSSLWQKQQDGSSKGKTMLRCGLLAAGAAMLFAVASPACADTKAGFDKWNRGDFYGAVAEWRPLAIAGDPVAQYNLAKAYQLGRGLPVDMKMAESWYGKAAQQGHVPSRDNYGLLLFQNGDRTSAMPYIEESANRGEPRAQYVLGTALFNGDTMKKDWVRAYALMTRASAAGISAASSSLAQMDKYIPLDQRQRGLTLARSYETSASNPQLAAGMVGDGPPPRPAVATEDLPPSDVGAPPPPTPKPVKTPKPPVVKTPPVKVAVAPPPPAPKPVPAPAPKPAPAPQPVASAGGWRIQLGAFSSDANAQRAWGAVAGRLSGLRPSYVRAGNIIRLQAGPLRDKAAAQRACAASGTSCIPVAP
ncbi:SPOR domain-containing protein [Sphingomonas sp. SUN039]|uniref:SPOR domain-containing protein n=1 Tax=Sphingomonas sp. SUN039 TaxID=2937787 RepID=UPI002164D049|nr:SPOR domain-containing protein [Sphingomonas sp. SUN039]UVO53890.1 SPOR domain-containing protein [Sphingomonas sp. SUN039]